MTTVFNPSTPVDVARAEFGACCDEVVVPAVTARYQSISNLDMKVVATFGKSMGGSVCDSYADLGQVPPKWRATFVGFCRTCMDRVWDKMLG
jgi:hypothetical protein